MSKRNDKGTEGRWDAPAHAAPHGDDAPIRFFEQDAKNAYGEGRRARRSVDGRAVPIAVLFVVLVAVGLVACVLPADILNPVARPDRSPGTIAAEMADMLAGLVDTLRGEQSAYSSYALEIVAAVLAGAALGLSGGVYQGALKNALASPSTLGVMRGGTFGAILFAVFLSPYTSYGFSGSVEEYYSMFARLSPFEQFVELYGTFLASFVGCMAIVFAIMLIAFIAGRGKVSNIGLVVAGQVFSAVIGVVITWMRFYLISLGDGETAELLVQMQTVSFAGTYTAPVLLAFAVPLVACMVVVLGMSGRLSLLAFNDDEARSMGISTTRTRNLMVAACTVMTALVVSFCGPIGFVGFMVPHIARMIVGPDFRYLLPSCALLGAILVCVVHSLTMLGIPGMAQGSTGIFTSILGCIAFVVVAIRQRGSSNGTWL